MQSGILNKRKKKQCHVQVCCHCHCQWLIQTRRFGGAIKWRGASEQAWSHHQCRWSGNGSAYIQPDRKTQMRISRSPITNHEPSPYTRHLDSLWMRCKDRWCVVLREIDFLLKLCDRFLGCFTCGVKLLDAGFTHFFNLSSECSLVAPFLLSLPLFQTSSYATEQ